jgi:uncharacterized protein YaaQ
MKLIVAIVRDSDSDAVVAGLVERHFRVTRIASSGGFLRRGNTTLWVGTEDEKVDEALGLIRATLAPETGGGDQRRGMAFVLDVARYEQL